jgi:hypothetical protein
MIEICRERLTRINWFVGCLNDNIATRANFEVKCSGRIWKDRFKSLAILEEAALINTMVYIHVTISRTKIAEKRENSSTSIAERIA